MIDVQLETEVWGTLNGQKEFLQKITEFSEKFGAPKTEKRLILQVTDFNRRDLDTRIRITNGEPVVIQKFGDWNAEKREEVTLPLPKDSEFIARLYRMFSALLTSTNTQRIAMQLENHLFETDDVEIKLTHQSGASDVFSFEVEQLSKKIDLAKICTDLGLTPDLNYKDDVFWKAFSAKVNLDASNFTETELVTLIRPYLKA